MPKKTLIFIPTYNERENVTPMCEAILAHGLDVDVVFLDDNSPDGTGQVLDELAAKHPRLRIIHRADKAGIGTAHQEGIALAYREGYDRLLTLDCDFTHDPTLIPEFLRRSESSAVVVGSRFLKDGSLRDWNWLRKGLTNTGHFLMENMLGVSQDATGAYRVYDLNVIPHELFQLVKSPGYAFFFESMFILHINGFSISEIPMNLGARATGASKMTLNEVRRSTAMLMKLYFEVKTNPARFRLPRSAKFDPSLVDPQNWNDYWDQKAGRPNAVYDAIATVYRNAIMKPRLEAAITKEFAQGASLLHAGCGSGQLDEKLHGHARITAVDISPSAVQLYQRHNPRADVRHASIFDLPFDNETFDGAYNLGVVEHFQPDELKRAFSELHRVLKPGGKLVVFWPHAHATSVFVLNSAHWLLNDVLHKDVQFHPPEVSLVHSRKEAAGLLATGGFDLSSYDFSVKDMFVQAVVVATRA
jgi:dolichol-phosphate mannosyltransferase